MTETPWQLAERIAEQHLNDLGFFRVQRTAAGADGGLDVVGQGVAAQVKLLRTPVGSPDIQRLRGAAHRVEAVAFYAHRDSGYSGAARDIADDLGVSLFAYGLDGEVEAVNSHGVELQSPYAAVQRAISQIEVVSIRARAVNLICKQRMEQVQGELVDLMNYLQQVMENLPEDAAYDDLSDEVRAKSDLARELRERYQNTPFDAQDAAIAATNYCSGVVGELEDGNAAELIHSEWRERLTNAVSEAHNATDTYTSAMLRWLDEPALVQQIRETAIEIMGDADEAEVLRDWPVMSRLCVP